LVFQEGPLIQNGAGCGSAHERYWLPDFGFVLKNLLSVKCIAGADAISDSLIVSTQRVS
jgi:hypothetical protein